MHAREVFSVFVDYEHWQFPGSGEIFLFERGGVPRPIFDTQLAAPLLGLPEQIKYGNIVVEMLDLTLGKAQAHRLVMQTRPLETFLPE